MNTFNLHRYTFIRLVIPLIAGVFCGDWFFDEKSGMTWSLLISGFFAVLSLVFYFSKRYSFRWCFGISLLGLCFMGGWMSMANQLKQTVCNFPKKEAIYRVLLTDKPEMKERSFLCHVILEERLDSVNENSGGVKTYPIHKQAILYFKKDSLTAQLKGGEELLISALLAPPKNEGNFDEFDYARYLMRKGISGTGYVASGKWKQLFATSFSHSNPPAYFNYDIISSLRTTASFYRDKLLALYGKLGFEGDELAVLSALTVGDKTELSESIRESYSISGASHVLALSGLHIGLLYALLFFMLKPLTERWRLGRCLRSIILLLLLWSFAFFTGLSPSVVRSASMFSILALADLVRRESLSLNTVAATAFLMLLCNPVWLFDVGFQLSFLAVVAILLIQPLIYRLIPIQNKVGKYIWGLMSVSIAAQLGTAPFVLYYFSRFSTHFLLTNLIVIPLVTIILYAAVFMLFLTPLFEIQEFIASIVRFLLKALNGFIHWIEHLPYASLDNIGLYQSDVALIYLLFSFVCCYFIIRRVRILLLSLSSLLLLCLTHEIRSLYDRPQQSIVFYNVRNCPVVHCVAGNGRSWLLLVNNHSDKRRLYRITANYWKHQHLQVPIELTTDYQSEELQVSNQILSFGKSRVCMINDNRWANKITVSPLHLDYLYLCRGYKGTVSQLTPLFSFSSVVLDTSLPEYQKSSFSDECKRLHIDCHSLSAEGAICFPALQ